MTLEANFNSNYELVCQLRRVIRVRKLRNNLFRFSWFMVGALILYKLADFGIPYMLDLYR